MVSGTEGLIVFVLATASPRLPCSLDGYEGHCYAALVTTSYLSALARSCLA